MDRKLLLVFALTFLVIMLFQPLLKKYGPQPPANSTVAGQQTPSSGQSPGGGAPSTGAATAGVVTAGAGSGQSVIVAAGKQATSESETVIENGLYRIVFTNRGAQVKSWVLKTWDDENGKPLDLVNQAASEKYGYPLSLWTYDETQRNKLNTALYAVTSSGSTAPAEISFEYSDGDVAVKKTFKFDHSYVVGVETLVQQKGAQVTAFPMWPAGFGGETTSPHYATEQVAYQYDSNVERLAFKKISGGNTVHGPFQWGGVSEQYFAAVFVPQDPQTAALVTLRNQMEIPRYGSDPNAHQMDKVDVLGAAVGNLRGPTVERLYVGPKAVADLETVSIPGMAGADPDLRQVLDFGRLHLIARPLFLSLKWTYNRIVHNWGWSILLLTLVINVGILPLRLTQMKSMLKMQRVAPQIKAIQEKYKKYSMRDPRKAEMNTEISEIYKREGVNPVGGCLPMLLPMFLLWPFYTVLTVAIDLRHAHWLWIHDLSAPDPTHVLPIAIIVTMFLMQRMTPQAGMDPAQQKMMNIMMPGMLGVMAWTLPSGLGLYWAAGQVIGIAQQAVMNRTSLGQEMREMMAKRARKKDK